MSTDLLVGASQTSSYPDSGLPELQELVAAGVFYGRKKSKTNPKMRKFVLMNRGGIEIINLAKTTEAVEKAVGFLKEKVQHGSLVLLIGTQPAAEENIVKLANKFQLPYVVTRWAGGTITNFKVLSKRIEYFKKLRSDLASGALEKYTKKERLMLEKELGRLKELFGGLENLTKQPDVLVVVNPSLHTTAVREANKIKIPVIALANVDANPEVVDCIVPGNDSARKSINWFLGKIEAAIEEGQATRVEAAKPEEVESSKTELKKDEGQDAGHTKTP